MSNNSTSKLRVWRKDDFDDCANEDQRFDCAWAPPDRVGFGYAASGPGPRTPVESINVAAESYADFCHAQRNGWEWSWPLMVDP